MVIEPPHNGGTDERHNRRDMCSGETAQAKGGAEAHPCAPPPFRASSARLCAHVRRALAKRHLDGLLAIAALHLDADLASGRAREHRAGEVFLRADRLAVDSSDDIADL